jgi:hypothetical protein
VNWHELEHAYGRADDTPRHLAALLGDDRAAVDAAINHLETAVVHQGFPYPAAVPVARAVANLLDNAALDPGLRTELLDYLGQVAEAVLSSAHVWRPPVYLPDLHQTLVQTFPTVYAFVDHDETDFRMIATDAAVQYALSPALAERRPALVALLRQRADTGDHRAWHVRQLAHLGDDTTGYLDDADPEVRVTAALAPTAVDDDEATAIIIDALTRAAAAPVTVPAHPDPLIEYANSLVLSDRWCGYTLAQLIRAAAARVVPFDRIARPAAEIVRTASWTGAERTWGPLVRAAFRTPYRPDVPLGDAQRLVLAALVENPQLWDTRNGNVGLVFKAAGLPHDRGACREL